MKPPSYMPLFIPGKSPNIAATTNTEEGKVLSSKSSDTLNTVTMIITDSKTVLQSGQAVEAEDDSGNNESRIIKDILSSINQKMKSFIHETIFDGNGFENAAAQIQTWLTHIESWTTVATPYDEDSLAQLYYTKQMFFIMLDSNERLKHYEGIPGAGNIVLWLLIDLNVRMLELLDVYGVPDPSIEGYAARVSSYGKVLSFVRDTFGKYREVVFGTHLTFQNQLVQAENGLKVLARYL
ncbi:hypothetical protein JCM33374_g5276 [Metschnikowia sp. JCM 33374]|nr:hypothetical protein JCM33374_g5276 [Metschnikowia sp. JCM 33374]